MWNVPSWALQLDIICLLFFNVFQCFWTFLNEFTDKMNHPAFLVDFWFFFLFHLQKYHTMNTTDFGWPISAPVKTVGSKIFLEARKGLSPFGFLNERQCKKGAYKQIWELLKQYGLKDNEILYLDKNSRSFISAEAFILTVIAGNKLRDPSKSAEQFPWARLCLFFVQTVVNSTFARETVDASVTDSTTRILTRIQHTKRDRCREQL